MCAVGFGTTASRGEAVSSDGFRSKNRAASQRVVAAMKKSGQLGTRSQAVQPALRGGHQVGGLAGRKQPVKAHQAAVGAGALATLDGDAGLVVASIGLARGG